MDSRDSLKTALDLIAKGARFIPVHDSIPFHASPASLEVFRKVLADRNPKSPAFYLQRSRMVAERLTPVETLLAFDPFEILRFSGDGVSIENSEGIAHKIGEPFTLLSERIAKYKLPKNTELESFFGAALGYFAYDAVRFLEPKLSQGEGNLARLSASANLKSDEKIPHRDGEFMFFQKRIVYDHVHGRILFGSGFVPQKKDNEALFFKAQREVEELKKIFLSLKPAAATKKVPLKSKELSIEKMQALLGKKAFLNGVKRLKEHIRAGDIFQAVLAEQFRTPFTGDALDLFETLSQINPSPYEFYFSTGERTLLGASPEMLLKVAGSDLETHPIAGTRPRGANAKEEKKLESQLLRSVKEKAEHLMLVDLARNDIGRVSSVGRVKLDSFMELKKFGSVMHLVSRVRGSLKPEISGLQALASCFPAGTLSGAPKIRAMQILSEIETAPRGFYGGAVVAVSLNGDLDSCIAIRSVRIEDGMATVQAGAGVVADSQPEREYQEVLHKTKMVRRALAMVGATGGAKPARKS